MTSYLQVLGAGGPDSPPSLLLFFDQSRYLINTPEGLQRLSTTHSIRLSKVHHVLLTRLSTRTIGGLPGLSITLADLGVRRLRVMGGAGVGDVLRGVRGFSIRSRLDVDVVEMGDGEERREEELRVTALSLGCLHRRMRTPVPPPPGPPAHRLSPLPSASSAYHSEDDAAIASLPSTTSPSPLRPSPHPPPPSPSAPFTLPYPVLSFVLSLPPTPGKFLPHRARALGLLPGPLYARLKAGEDVEVEGGRVVRARDVVEEGKEGRVVGVVDLPWVGRRGWRWARRLQRSAAWGRWQGRDERGGGEGGEQMTLLVHLTPLPTLSLPPYQQWMRRFPTSTQHVLINASLAPLPSIFHASTTLHRRLLMADPNAFACDPSLAGAEREGTNLTRAMVREMVEAGSLPSHTVAGEAFMRLPLLPITTSTFPLYDAARTSLVYPPVDVPLWEAQLSAVKEARRALLPALSSSVIPVPYPPDLTPLYTDDPPPPSLPPPSPLLAFHPDPSILLHLSLLPSPLSPSLTFLGTGSAIPSKYRNVTAIHFYPGLPCSPSPSGGEEISRVGGIMLDCGEGTLGQCVRKWGVEGARDAIAGLALVFVSHMHADHHLGLQSLLGVWVESERSRREKEGGGGNARRLRVVGPRKLRQWLIVHWQRTFETDTLPSSSSLSSSPSSSSPLDGDDAKDGSDDDEEVIDDELFDYIDFYPCHTLLSAPHHLSAHLASLPVPLSLTTAPVRHCPDSYAVSLHTLMVDGATSGVQWKLVYSGDTMPSAALVQLGMGATVLVHEATFEDGMEAEARDKRHSTGRQAVEVARAMGVQSLVLTHFSQRYPKLSVLGESGDEERRRWVDERVVLAFDLMTVEFRDLYWLSALVSGVTDMVKGKGDEGEEEVEEKEEKGRAEDKPSELLGKRKKPTAVP